MCSELILAILYFLTILTVNFFIFKTLKNYLADNFYLIRIKNVFRSFPKNTVKFIALLYFLRKNEFKNLSLFKFAQKFTDVNDVLIIGKTFDHLATNSKQNNQQRSSLVYYFKLLASQYL
jgi:hypothetical protein